MVLFFLCFVEPKCTTWTTLLAFWRCHAIGFPGVRKNQFLEKQSYHSGGFFSGRKKQNKTTVFGTHHSEGTTVKAARGVPRNLRFLVFCWTPWKSPSLSQDPPALPGTLLGHSQDSAGLLPESSGDPLPGKLATGFSQKGNIIRPAFRNGRTSCFVPLGSLSSSGKSAPGRCVVRLCVAKAATDGSLTVLYDERLPPCWCDPTLLKVTVPIQLVCHRLFFFSEAAMNESVILKMFASSLDDENKFCTPECFTQVPSNNFSCSTVDSGTPGPRCTYPDHLTTTHSFECDTCEAQTCISASCYFLFPQLEPLLAVCCAH